MNIPRYIKVGGFNYLVERPEEPFLSDSVLCDGDHNFINKIIRVAKNGTRDYQDLVFIHELCHAIISYFTPELEQDEKFVEQFSKGLYQVLVDNPKVFESAVTNAQLSESNNYERP
jgi:hypothetical protein